MLVKLMVDISKKFANYMHTAPERSLSRPRLAPPSPQPQLIAVACSLKIFSRVWCTRIRMGCEGMMSMISGARTNSLSLTIARSTGIV